MHDVHDDLMDVTDTTYTDADSAALTPLSTRRR
jgi:hypothetical protein